MLAKTSTGMKVERGIDISRQEYNNPTPLAWFMQLLRQVRAVHHVVDVISASTPFMCQSVLRLLGSNICIIGKEVSLGGLSPKILDLTKGSESRVDSQPQQMVTLFLVHRRSCPLWAPHHNKHGLCWAVDAYVLQL